MKEKTHYRKAFNSPYLSSADIVAPTVLTVKCVRLEPDKTKKTKDHFNTAYFVEKELRQGEELKPMILNATNSRTMKSLTGSAFIEDWNNVSVMVYVEQNVRFGRDTVEGLRISTEKPNITLPPLVRGTDEWKRAIDVYKRDGNLNAVTSRRTVSDEDMEELKRLSNVG